MHGVLATHLIGKGRHAELILHLTDHVQIGHARLDHHAVGPFLNIQRHFVQGFVAIGRIHLIGGLVALAEVAGRTDRIAERAVVAGGVLGGVGHDLGVDEAILFQRGTDGADAAIHHVGRRDDIDPGLGVREGLLDQDLGGDVVQHIAFVIDDAVLTVGGERIERHVGDDPQLREAGLEGARCPLGQSVRVVGLFRHQALALQRGHREQGDSGHTQLHQLGSLDQQQIDGETLHPRHGGNGFPTVLPLQHEHRIDEIVDGQYVLAHQTTAEIMFAQTAQAAARKGARKSCSHESLLERKLEERGGGGPGVGQQGLGRFTTTGRHHLGDVRQKSGFVAFRARFQIARHQIGCVGLDHQAAGWNAGHLLAQQLAAAFVAEPAGHPDMQPQRQTLVQLLVGAGEAVQHGSRQSGQPGPQDLDETGVRIAAVEKHRHPELGGQCQLGVEYRVLHRAGGEIAVVVETALADGHHLRQRRQLAQGGQGRLIDTLGIVGMDPGGGEAVARPTGGKGSALAAAVQIGTGQDQRFHSGSTSAGHQLSLLAGKLAAGQV